MLEVLAFRLYDKHTSRSQRGRPLQLKLFIFHWLQWNIFWNITFLKYFPTLKVSIWNKTHIFLCSFLFYFLLLLQNYSDELAVSAQAWVDQCTMSHGPPTTRMLNGIFLLSLFFLSLCFPFIMLLYPWHAKVPCELTDGVIDDQSHSEHNLIYSLNTFF